MEREPAGDDENRVDADVVARAGVTRRELFGRGDNAAQAVLVERIGGRIGGGALLDLDKCHQFAAAGDDVDFAATHLHSPGEDPPAVKAKPPGGDGFRAATSLFGLAAAQALVPSARARA
jgi:hypothetical protein